VYQILRKLVNVCKIYREIKKVTVFRTGCSNSLNNTVHCIKCLNLKPKQQNGRIYTIKQADSDPEVAQVGQSDLVFGV